jgi:two-component system nitrate/nitrite response regulator NarL
VSGQNCGPKIVFVAPAAAREIFVSSRRRNNTVKGSATAFSTTSPPFANQLRTDGTVPAIRGSGRTRVRLRDRRTLDLAQNDPPGDSDAAGSAAGNDRAFRRAFATALVGPNFLELEGLKGILSAAGFRVVASASRVTSLVLGPEVQSEPILLVVNARNDLRSAVKHIELFKERHESGRVVVIADPGQQSEIPAVFRAGANGYLFMGPSLEPFIKALELVMLGETVLPKAIVPLILERDDEMVPIKAPENFAPQLSRRERLILRHLAEGLANKVIASEIGIAQATVKVHVKSILTKIGVVNRTQAAIWAMNNGLVIGAPGGKRPVTAGKPGHEGD